MKKHILFSVAILAIGVFIAICGHLDVRSSQDPQHANGDRAERSRSMRVRAMASDRDLVSIASPSNLTRFNTLEQLVSGSILIINGTVEKTTSVFSESEDFIFTDCRIAVTRVISGRFDGSESITVRVPGGKIQLENGKTAETRMPDFWRSPLAGKEYVFFLTKDEFGNFKIRGGPQGMFEIRDGVLTPQGFADDALAIAYKGRSFETISNEIASIVKSDVALRTMFEKGGEICRSKAGS